MPAQPENIGHFYFNSDYPTDKIVWLYENQRTTSSDVSQGHYFYIVNNMPYHDYPIFVKGAVSFDDWQTAIPFGSSYWTSDGYRCYTTLSWNADSGEPGVEVFYDFHDRPSSTMKYRMWGVQREDIAFPTDYGRTAARALSAVKFDTNLNYPRLIKDGVAKSGEVIAHNLGRIPYVDYWFAYSSNKDALLTGWQYNPTGYFGNGAGPYPCVRADSKNVTFQQIKYLGDEQGTDIVYYYRIYG